MRKDPTAATETNRQLIKAAFILASLIFVVSVLVLIWIFKRQWIINTVVTAVVLVAFWTWMFTPETEDQRKAREKQERDDDDWWANHQNKVGPNHQE